MEDSSNKYLSLCHCEDCPLRGRPKVLGSGSRDYLNKEIVDRPLPQYNFIAKTFTESLVRTGGQYRLALVGIAPAELETKLLRPMVGWSGQLIKESLEKIGIKEYYVTNALLCSYPEDATASTINQAVKCCRGRLLEELRLIGVDLAVALGNVPLEALTGESYKIRSVIGRIIPCDKLMVLPIPHPAGLKRRPDEFRDYIDALRQAPKYFASVYQTAEEPHTIIANEDNLGDICQDIENHELVAVDLETTGRGFYPYGRDPDQIRCMVVATSAEDVYIIPGKSSPHFESHPDFVQDPRLKEVISKAKCITHNGPFDVGFLKQAGYDVSMYFDTFLAHYMLDEREFSHGLKSLAAKYTGAPDWESTLHNYLPNKNSSYDLIPDDVLYKYASWDGTQTFQLSEGVGFRKSVPKIFWDLLMPCANMFTSIRHKGFRIDVEYLMNLDEVLEKEYIQSLDELESLAGFPINPLSPQDVAESLYGELKFTPIQRYGRSTGKAVMREIGGPICEKILECREIAKLKSTYVLGISNFIDDSFRIHPFTKLHGAVTGRISTEDPSVMNVTKKGGIKKLYVPEEDHLIMEADQGQMEFRCYAIIADDTHMRQIFMEDRDPHMEVAQHLAHIRGIDWETMTKEERKILRQRCKSGDFGRLYGRGLDSFIHGYGLDNEAAMEFVNAIDQVFPGIKAYNKSVISEIHSKGFLDSYFNRRRRFGLILDENRNECYRQGANFKVQSMASDINLFCMLHLWSLRDKLGIFPMFPVHDSIVMDVSSKDLIPAVYKELTDYAESLVDGKIKFKAEIAYGKNWGETVVWSPD